MTIIDTLGFKRTISYEFYPPRGADGIPAVFRAINRLAPYNPDFISVTYGAGGTTRAFTEEIAIRARRETDLTVMAHITCAGQSQQEIDGVLGRLQDAGIENLIALRGDPPAGEADFVPMEGGFAHATDLMKHIKANFNFCLAGACYPEGHVSSPDLQTDIEHTKWRVEAGAEFLITQLFYDNDDFYAFVERARRAGIDVPIIAGVLPVLSASQIRRFTQLGGEVIPPKLDVILEQYAEDDDGMREAGIDYATKQVQDLWEQGVQGIHFFALNRSYSISKILDNLNLPGHSAQ
ncbi:MAG: methylenetetrahydrofolate reductase [NAD(P)H] [SAR202 cluster bacterium Casp-Chloro-G4]|nr:methylenetetrahydrofolate reductase [NAD(P)H] [Chloroflexota bacterium]MDA1227347.1 methylenetetrahydrofolate reductase [NAD(P)H] [Chloroflexota bacterium]PKB61809.1 MAG: methylenetetrahydrofolate reductase [NAD(P)H] [SAR202 cluster bacterium Casp-Chloro-G4]